MIKKILFITMIVRFVVSQQCSPAAPCSNGACCSKYGWCGTTPEYCAVDQGCVSNCSNEPVGITNQCGPNLPCSDGTCCSQWGWCGTGPDYCGEGCQNNCEISQSSSSSSTSSAPFTSSTSTAGSSSSPATTTYSTSSVVSSSQSSTSTTTAPTYPTDYYDNLDENPWYDPRGVYSSCNIKGTIVLTFDDGPWSTTPRILDILLANNIKATFFVIGQNIQGNEALILRAHNEGHIIASHSWSHPDFTTLTNAQIAQELIKTESAIYSIIGASPKYFRPPYGAIDDRVIDQVVSRGYKMIMWNLDSNDWVVASSRKGTGANVYSNIESRIEPYQDISQKGWIILEYDTYSVTADSLQAVIDYGNYKGYSFKTTPECFFETPYWY